MVSPTGHARGAASARAVAAGALAAIGTLAPMAALAAESPESAATAAAAPAVLQSVEVVGTRNPQDDTTGLVTNVFSSVQDTPQIVNVVPHELIQQQKITTLEQALRDVPGITIAIGEGGTLAGDQFKIRGLDASNDIYSDGLRDFGVYTRDAFDDQEVQVLKGPSAALFGRGTTGGAINTISKEPLLGHEFINVDGTVGNGDYYRATVDLNHQINDTTAFRINLMGNSTGVVDRDKVGSDRFGVAAAVGFGLGTSMSFIANYFHQQDDRVPDYGIVIGAPTGVVKALPATEYGLPQNIFEQFNTDQDKTRADILTGRFRWDLSPNLTISSDSRFGSYDRYFQYTSVDSCLVNAVTHQTCIDALIDNNPNTLPLITFGGGGPYSQRAWGAQNITSVHALFDTFGFKNELVAGTDYNHQDSRRAFFAYNLPPISSGVYAPGITTPARNKIAINLLTGAGSPPPGYTIFRPGPIPGIAATGQPNTSITTNAYILESYGFTDDYAGFFTDRLYLTPQISIIGGLRYDVYQAHFANDLVSGVRTSFTSRENLSSPHISLVYEPDAYQTYYASYNKSATPIGTAIVGSATPIASTTAAFAPDEGESYEFGGKKGFLNGRLSLDAAYFHVDKANARMTDPTTGDISAQSSQKQTIQGVEAGLTGQITHDWGVNIAYTYLDTTVRQDLACTTTAPIQCFPNPFTVGQPVLQVPENSAFVWTSYKLGRFVHGLSVAGGVTYEDGFYVRYTTTGIAPNLTLTSAAYVPSTFSLDGVLQYEAGRWRAAVNVYNLTDRLNYAQSFGNRAAPANGRTVLFSLGYSF